MASAREFVYAVHTGDLDEVQHLASLVPFERDYALSMGSYMAPIPYMGWSQLFEEGEYNAVLRNLCVAYAAFWGHLHVVQWLASQGADIRANNSHALRAAAHGGHLNIVEWLTREGCDIRALCDDALMLASEHGNLDVVCFLVENGADVTARDNEPIILASSEGNLEVVRFLVENGVYVTAQDNQPIIEAAGYGHLTVVRFLAENGADVTARDNEPIISASFRGHLDIVQWLAENGADVSAQAYRAITEARKMGHLDVVVWIIFKGDSQELEERDEDLDPSDVGDRCVIGKESLKRGARFRMCAKRHIMSEEWNTRKVNRDCLVCYQAFDPFIYTNTGPGPSEEDDGGAEEDGCDKPTMTLESVSYHSHPKV